LLWIQLEDENQDQNSEGWTYAYILDCITTPTATSSHSTVSVDLCKRRQEKLIANEKKISYLGVLRQNMLPAVDHVDEGLSSPVLRNSIGKF
jgi:hypothetical protein